MPSLARPKFQQTITDVALLQFEVKMLGEKLDDLKVELKDVHNCLDKNMAETKTFLENFQEKNDIQLKEITTKISGFEKLKWMFFGIAIVIGATGAEAIQMIVDLI
jgi:FtsZ-binding cell division protein ZapB